MKILHISPFLGEQFGGTERFCLNLSQQLASRGHEVHVFTSRTLPSSPKQETIKGVKVFRFLTLKNVWEVNPLVFMFHKLLSAKYDVVHVHSHLYFSSNQVILAKIFRSFGSKFPPMVLHLHGGLGTPPRLSITPVKHTIKRCFDKTLGALSMVAADSIIAQSKAVARRAKQQYPSVVNKIITISHTIDTDHFCWSEQDSPPSQCILFVGDLEYWKGITVLIDAMRILKEFDENFSLRVVGVGSLASLLKKRADGLDVDFLGQQLHTDIPLLMNGSFACVLPSLWEAIPTVGLEAMASGVPFVGSRVGGIPEIIEDYKTGLLVNPNSPSSLVEAIIALKDVKLWRRIRRAAYELVTSRHDIRNVIDNIKAIYENLRG